MTDTHYKYPILCVDDEAFLLDVCRLFLESTDDFRVTTALSAEEAVKLISEVKYEAVVSDYEMPGMSGIDLLKEIRSQGIYIPFIIFTGKGREDVVIEALNNGADFYLQKGGEPKSQFVELASKIHHAIRQKSAEKSLEFEREQLLSIFDSLEQMVYVSDPESHEILYVNKYFQNMLKRDVIGKKCYSELMQNTSPCDFCTNSIILEKNPDPYIWEFFNPIFECYYSVIDRIIKWPDGRNVRLEVATDITEAKQAIFDLSAAYEEIASSDDELKHQLSELKKSQQHLKESEERYRSLIENIQDVIYRSDLSGNLIMVSPSVLKMFGCNSMEEILGKNIAETFYLNHKDRDKFLKAIEKDGSVYNYEATLVKMDGTPIYVSTNSHLFYDHEGNLAGIEGVFRDITSIKNISTALRESEQLYRILVEHTQDGVFIVQDEAIVFCNESFANMIGYLRDELIGMPISNIISSEDREEVIWNYRMRIEGKPSPEFYKFRMLHKDQKTKILFQISVGLGEYRRKPASIGTIRNVLYEKNKIEEALRESHSILNSILQESPIPQFVIDTNHKVKYWNHALEKYSNIHAEEIIGTTSHWKAFYPSERPCLVDLMLIGDVEEIRKWYQGKAEKSRLVDDAFSVYDFFPGIGENGTWLFFTGAILRDSEGKVWGALETLEDISNQKMNEEGLRQANNKLNLLANITRHDILNTLTVLSGAIDLIRDEITDTEISLYISKAEMALDVIRRQITFTRDYQNLGVNAPLWQNLSEVINEALTHSLPGDIETILTDINLEIFADKMLGRVFSNLIDNSLRHGGHVKRVGFSVEKRDNLTILVYSDNGVGIPNDMKEHIFERGVGSNTGFGLFLVCEILSITNISIRETGEPGIGARFEIIIPPGYYRIKTDN